MGNSRATTHDFYAVSTQQHNLPERVSTVAEKTWATVGQAARDLSGVDTAAFAHENPQMSGAAWGIGSALLALTAARILKSATDNFGMGRDGAFRRGLGNLAIIGAMLYGGNAGYDYGANGLRGLDNPVLKTPQTGHYAPAPQ